MGFRFRKGINLGGGFRINLSKSGIGYSFGGKGFRYTKKANGGYRETYSIYGTGLSWIKEHGKSKNNNQPLPEDDNSINEIDKQYLYSIENDISTSVNITSDAFLQSIRNFIKLNRIFSLLIILLFIAFIISLDTIYAVKYSLFLLFFISIIIKIIYRNIGRVKTKYDFDEIGEKHTKALSEAIDCLKNCISVWQMNDIFSNQTKRTNAGAAQSISRTKIKIVNKKPYFLNTNTACYLIKLKKEKLYILPDIIIIINKKVVNAFNIKDLKITVSDINFIEDIAPNDAEILSYTWQFVNNNGTPDKRYKNNRQLPICHYGVLSFQTDAGFNTKLCISNYSKVLNFKHIVENMNS